MINSETRKYRISFTEDILGSWPADPAIFTRFISSKAPANWLKNEEDDVISERGSGSEVSGLTVFPQDKDGIFLMNYHVKGFLKESAATFQNNAEVAMLRSKLDKYVFVFPRRLYIHRPDGSVVTDIDSTLERALRGETMQGPRVSLRASELIKAPVYIEFEIQLLENFKKVLDEVASEKASLKAGKATKKRVNISEVTWELLEETLLDYGRYKGISQWRNGGYGQFLWKRLD